MKILNSSFRKIIGFAALGTLFLLTGVPTKNVQAKPPLSMTPFFARAEITLTSIKTATCEGENGEVFTFFHLKGQGPITATDPRMEGTFFANAKLLHNAQGVGVSRDDLKIRDTQTGQLKATGVALSLDAGFEPIKAMTTIDLADGSRVWTEATVRLPAPGTSDPVILEYGGAGSGIPEDRAVLVTGDCRRFFNED